jgi:2-hydroxychromene-2-carboxylate isomerase
VFVYDLASPWCWIAAELVNSALDDGVPEWQPVDMQALAPDAYARIRETDRDAIARLAPMPPRWPGPLPADTHTAMLAATFAKKSGRVVAFSLAAFRQAFAAGKDLTQPDNVLIAAAACELHPRAVLKGIETRSTIDELQRATDAARDNGVTELPALIRDDGVHQGVALVDFLVTASMG